MFSSWLNAPASFLFSLSRWAFYASLCFVLLSCSRHKKLSHEESCNDRYTKLKEKFDKERYIDVRQGYNDLLTDCPGSQFTEQAQFELAESYFLVGDWMEAESEYKSFVREFPSSDRFGEVAKYRLAVSQSKQSLNPHRDQELTIEALESFKKFLNDHGDSKYSDSAKASIAVLQKKLAKKDMLIARLYLRMDEAQAAAIYYKEVLNDYGEWIDKREVTLNLAQCYIKMEQFDEAESYLGQFDNIAKNDDFKEKITEAYADLEKARKRFAKRKAKEKAAQEQSDKQL